MRRDHRIDARPALGQRRPPSPARRARAKVLCAVVFVASSLPLIALSGDAAAAADDLIDVGLMEPAVSEDSIDPGVPQQQRGIVEPSPMIVDERHNLGFASGFPVGDFANKFPFNEVRLVMYDLENPDRGVIGSARGFAAGNIFRFAVDTRAGLLLGPKSEIGVATPQPCTPESQSLQTYEYAVDPATREATLTADVIGIPIPCSGVHKFLPLSASIYEAGGARKLLLAGTYEAEGWRFNAFTAQLEPGHNLGQALIIRQLDLATLYAQGDDADPDSLDWEIDLRYVGCGRWEGDSILLGRMGDDLVTYCWDTRPVVKAAGAQGYVVRIPLGADHAPDTAKGTPVLPDPANPTNAAPPIPGLPTPSQPTPPGVDFGKILDACRNAGGLPVVQPPFDPVKCAEAAAGEARRQGVSNVDYLLEEYLPGLIPGGVPDPPDPTDPPDVDPDNPLNSKFIANPVARRTPTLPGTVYPFLDPASGRLLLLTADQTNGNAVWAFDPRAERFIGLIAPGGTQIQGKEKTAAGFDAVRGRAYLFTAKGVLAAAVRPSPLPSGKVHPVYASFDHETNWRRLAVAPGARRGFIPLIEKRGDRDGDGQQEVVFPGGYGVFQDDIPDPPSVTLSSPDSLTKQIDEQPGKTEVNVSGAAEASGSHVVIVGGIPRAVNQLDPLCEPPFIVPSALHERKLFNSRCLADQLLSSGKREFFLARGVITAGTSTGATGEAAGFAAADDATDADVRNVASCGRATAEGLWGGFNEFTGGGAGPFPFGDLYQACDPIQDGLTQILGDDLRNGTGGGQDPDGPNAQGIRDFEDADGFPVPETTCDDPGGKPESAQGPGGQLPKNALFRSSVTCDAAKNLAAAHAVSTGLAYPDPANPTVSVARTSTDIRSERKPEGQVTTATATAEGVQIGPLRIGKVETVATVRAKGRTGTASATFSRVWCGIEGTADLLGQAFKNDQCVDPVAGVIKPVNPATGQPIVNPATQQPVEIPVSALIDDVNQALGKVRLTVPEVEQQATPGGFQAVVTKDPDVRAADRTVNADDSITVPGLQVTVYNDGEEGLNRFIVQLAGIHTEARYGITLLPDFDIPDFPDVEGEELARPELTTFDPVRRTPGREFVEMLGVEEVLSKVDLELGQQANESFGVLRDILRWLINNWREALLLFLVFSILATPVYLGVRRRAFERELAL